MPSKLDALIAELCPEGVEFVPLCDVALICDGVHQTPKYTDCGVPFVSVENIANLKTTKKFISREDFDRYKVKPQKNDLFMTRIGRLGLVNIVDDDNPLAYYVTLTLIRPLKIDSRFLLHTIRSTSFQDDLNRRALLTAVPPKINLGEIGKLIVPLPPLPVQHEIVRMLDKFSALTAALTKELAAEIAARKKQYDYYRNALLTFGDDVPMVALGEIATDMYRGAGIKRDEVTKDGTPCVRYGEIYTTYGIWFDTCVSRTHAGSKEFEHGDILFAITGESVAEIAKSCAYMGREKCYAGGDIVVMKHKQNPKYISYALSTADAQAQKSKGKVKSKVVHSGIPALKAITIPLPSLEEQARIVAILDKFDVLTTDLTSGLPAEIAARQKQYEYYRDKLLTFKEKTA